MKKISNTFELSGFIANDAQIRNSDTQERAGTDGKKNQRVVLVAMKFHRTPEMEEQPETSAKKSSKKSKKAA